MCNAFLEVKINLEEGVRFAQDICHGMAYLHSLEPLITRFDLTPHNVFVGSRCCDIPFPSLLPLLPCLSPLLLTFLPPSSPFSPPPLYLLPLLTPIPLPRSPLSLLSSPPPPLYPSLHPSPLLTSVPPPLYLSSLTSPLPLYPSPPPLQIDDDMSAKLDMAHTRFSFMDSQKLFRPNWMAPECMLS